LFVFLAYNLLAETEEEKSRISNLIDSILTYIIDNGFVLIDVTGQPTQWGKWRFVFLNLFMFVF